jgi:hypothetical protein
MTSYYARTSQRRRTRGMNLRLSADGLLDMARRRPEALLLIGAGVALMMRSGSGFSLPKLGLQGSTGSRNSSSARGRTGAYSAGEGGREWSEAAGGAMSSARGAVREAADNAGRMAEETGEEMTRYASQMIQSVSETVSSYAASASRAASSARDGVMDRTHRLADRARSLPEELDEAVQDHPLVLAALGLAVGAALGATLPASSIENRTMGRASDGLWEAAEDATGRIGDAAEEAYEEAWRAARERGLSADGLKEMAGEVGSKFAEVVSGEEDTSGSPQAAKPVVQKVGASPTSSSASTSVSSAGASKPTSIATPGNVGGGSRDNKQQS